MFAAFNVMGEGSDELDETILDLARDVGLDVPTDLTTNIYDTAFDAIQGSAAGGYQSDQWRARSSIHRFQALFRAVIVARHLALGSMPVLDDDI